MEKDFIGIKAVLTDLDGTIITDNNEMSPATIKTIRNIQKKGLLFIPVTGRCYEDVKTMFQKYHISCPFILLNGAQYCDTDGTVIIAEEMHKAQADEIIRILKTHSMSIGIYAGLSMYNCKDSKTLSEEYQYMFPEIMLKTEDYEELSSDLPVYKIEAIHEKEENLKNCLEELCRMPAIEVTSSMHHNIEITNIFVTKAKMAQKVLSQYHIKKEELIVFGDSLNDISMFETFPNSVAMENACREIKTIAAFQCASCDQNGFSEFLDFNILL